MNRALLLLLGMLVFVAAQKYEDDRFTHIDVDEILSNQRILTAFIKCFLDEGPCTADARDIKKHLPEVIDSNCSKCTDTQKMMMAKVVIHVKDKRPNDWDRLAKKYDPDQTKRGNLDSFLKEALAL